LLIEFAFVACEEVVCIFLSTSSLSSQKKSQGREVSSHSKSIFSFWIMHIGIKDLCGTWDVHYMTIKETVDSLTVNNYYKDYNLLDRSGSVIFFFELLIYPHIYLQHALWIHPFIVFSNHQGGCGFGKPTVSFWWNCYGSFI